MEIEVAQRRAGRSDLARWLDEGSTACGGTGEWWMLIEHDTGRYVTASRQDSGAAEAERAVLAGTRLVPIALFTPARAVPRVSGLINECEFCKRVCRPSSTLGNTNDKMCTSRSARDKNGQ